MIREANKAGYVLHFKNLATRRHKMAPASRQGFAKHKKKKAEAVELHARQLAAINLEKWEPIADKWIELRGWDLERNQSNYMEFEGAEFAQVYR